MQHDPFQIRLAVICFISVLFPSFGSAQSKPLRELARLLSPGGFEQLLLDGLPLRLF